MFQRLLFRGHLLYVWRESDTSPLVCWSYENQAGEEPPAVLLPNARTIVTRTANAGARSSARTGPDDIWWIVNSAPGRGAAGPIRRVFRLVTTDGPARWREAGDEEVAALAELERKEDWEATRDVRERTLAESAAIRTAGFHIAETADGWTYRDRDLVLAERPAGATGGDEGWLRVDVPREEESGRVILRPWRMWIAEDDYWRPEYDAALTPARRLAICARLRAWLAERHVEVRLVPTLPSATAPITVERVSFAVLRSILEFLLASGMRLAGSKPGNPHYPGSGDPMEVFRGRGAPRKWYATQGGEQNVHLQGPIPVDLVRGAFRLPSSPGRQSIGVVTVSARVIEASGGDLWEGFIWAGRTGAGVRRRRHPRSTKRSRRSG